MAAQTGRVAYWITGVSFMYDGRRIDLPIVDNMAPPVFSLEELETNFCFQNGEKVVAVLYWKGDLHNGPDRRKMYMRQVIDARTK